MLLRWGWLPHYVVDLPNYGLLNMLRWLGLVQLQAGLPLGLQEKLQILLHLLQLQLVVHDVQALLDDLFVGALVVPGRGGCQRHLGLLRMAGFHLLEMAQRHSHSWCLQRSLGGHAVSLLNLVGPTSTALVQLLGREGLSHPPGHILQLRARLLLQPSLRHLPRLGGTPWVPVLVLQAVLQREVLLVKGRRLVEALVVGHVLVRRVGFVGVRDAEAVGAAQGC